MWFLALATAALAARPAGADDAVISLAGSFNGWKADDAAARLTPAGSRYEVTRFWPCGGHEFKFVFDGSWSRHLGAGHDGGLTQPGDNIRLAFPQTGFYAVWLDPVARKWGWERRPATALSAVMIVHGDSAGTAVVLDGRASLAPAGRSITGYRWDVESLDRNGEASPGFRLEAPGASRSRLTVDQPGRYRIRLTVDDGHEKATAEQTRTLATGCCLMFVRGKGNVVEGPVFLPLDGGRVGAIWPDKKEDEIAGYLDPVRRQMIVSYEGPRDRFAGRCLVRIDQPLERAVLIRSGWQEFAYQADGDARLPAGTIVEHVDLIGEFNDWRPAATRMCDLGGAGGFRHILELPDGVYHYKFLVNGCIPLEDETADKALREPDGHGGFNSGFRIGDDAARFGPAQAGRIVREAVRHDPDDERWFVPLDDDLVELRLRTLATDVEAVDAVVADAGTLPMVRSETRLGFDIWSLTIAADWPAPYRFVIRDGSDCCFLDASGIQDDPMKTAKPFLRTSRPKFDTPDWAKKAVWYQIFPERFRNGDAGNDPRGTVPWTHAWFKPYRPHGRNGDGARPASSEKGTFYEFIYDRRYGGDLQGIREKLPYLRDLGVTAVYLNPIFQAESLHKYDASDYRHIDDAFGVKDSRLKLRGETADPKTWKWSESDTLFLDFLREAHAQGFKVVLDGVFNHVGREFWAFQDVLKRGEKSPYAEWFEFSSFDPPHYKAWDRDDGALPRLRHDDALGLVEPVREHLFAVTRRWMDPNGDGDPSDGIDGWRLDVAGDINAHFWRDWRKLVKSINPEAYIVAELWDESRAWLKGDCFDATMNYEFARRTQRFFVNQKKATKPSEFGREIEAMLRWYAPQVNLVLQNLIDSHDTDRIASMYLNPDLAYDQANRLQDNGPHYNPGRPTPDCYHKQRLFALFQMTFLGAPMVYYGDEVGMYGADDPNDRKPMLWDDLPPNDDPDERIVPGLREWYRRLIAIRHATPALQLGRYRMLLADDGHGVFAFARSLGNDHVVIVLNNSDHARRVVVASPWADETAVARLDDPLAADVVDPGGPTARPSIRLRAKPPGGWKIVDGHLRGGTLEPRSGAIFQRVPR